ncbi:MAG: peroxiredoxin family protein [Gemmataceae bacterium]
MKHITPTTPQQDTAITETPSKAPVPIVQKLQPKSGLPVGQLALLVILVVVGGSFIVVALTREKEALTDRKPKVIDTKKVTEEAKDYLEEQRVKHTQPKLVKTQEHKLLGKTAPDFVLFDHTGTEQRLSEIRKDGPVVLVFYYGFHCNHCVAQIFALNEDLPEFQKLGAKIVALSPDELTKTKKLVATLREEIKAKRSKLDPAYFDSLHLLADTKNKIAALYGASEGTGDEAFLAHGTFIISPQGKITWAQVGDEPFIHNETLLHELAKVTK